LLGYDEDEVDAFLDRIEERLRDPTANTLTAEDVHNVTFSKPPPGKQAYNEDEVDAFFGRVEKELSGRALGQ
jgi:DivIVA domain-containing protein